MGKEKIKTEGFKLLLAVFQFGGISKHNKSSKQQRHIQA
jgi:hypothetical protein